MPGMYTAYEDEALVVLLSQGDQDAFTALYDRYWKRVFAIAGAKLEDLELARDLVQDIFTDLWKRRSTLCITGSLEAYLAVAVKYKVINTLALRRRERLFGKDWSTLADSSTEQWLAFDDLKEELARLVDKLPDRCRITYQLKREYGLSQKEIARRMDISEAAVEQNISRALKTLRRGLRYFFFLFF